MAPPSREPTNWKFSKTTFNLLRFWPEVLSSHESSLRRPSIKSGFPLVQYFEIVSA